MLEQKEEKKKKKKRKEKYVGNSEASIKRAKEKKRRGANGPFRSERWRIRIGNTGSRVAISGGCDRKKRDSWKRGNNRTAQRTLHQQRYLGSLLGLGSRNMMVTRLMLTQTHGSCPIVVRLSKVSNSQPSPQDGFSSRGAESWRIEARVRTVAIPRLRVGLLLTGTWAFQNSSLAAVPLKGGVLFFLSPAVDGPADV